MEQGNSSMRERLLARLPQPQNLAAYREETASMLAKYEKALFWEKWGNKVLSLSVAGAFVAVSFLGPKLDTLGSILPRIMMGIVLLWAALDGLRVFIYRNQVDMLKEVKQVQLQVLELQDSLRKKGEL